jgi:hypothetical protein
MEIEIQSSICHIGGYMFKKDRLSKAKYLVVFVALALTLFITSGVLASSYDRDAGVAWIDAHAHDRPSDYPNYGTGTGNDCNDCTNYVNQMLDKGGYPQRPGTNDALHRYAYKNIVWRVSRTWYNTANFNVYRAKFTPAEFVTRASTTQLVKGDFFLMDLKGNITNEPIPDGKPDHARAIVGKGWTSTNPIDYGSDPVPPRQWTMLASQHCTDRWHVAWNYNVPSSVARWNIHVNW